MYFVNSGKKKLPPHVERARLNYKNAYLTWTKEDDSKLKELFLTGTKLEELCVFFGRNIGAINSRIEKLGLLKTK
jgi:hypothetical protein